MPNDENQVFLKSKQNVFVANVKMSCIFLTGNLKEQVYWYLVLNRCETHVYYLVVEQKVFLMSNIYTPYAV